MSRQTREIAGPEGRTLTVTYVPATQTEYSRSPARASVIVPGCQGRGTIYLTGSEADSIATSCAEADDFARKLAAERIGELAAYDDLAAELAPLCAYLPRGEEPDLPKAGVGDVEVGEVAWVYSRGNVRRGKIEKVGRTKLHVVYVSSTGTISRKADSHVWVER